MSAPTRFFFVPIQNTAGGRRPLPLPVELRQHAVHRLPKEWLASDLYESRARALIARRPDKHMTSRRAAIDHAQSSR